jgi:hypothetical protein
MIKTLIAQTMEADDPDRAVSEILEQLSIGQNLRDNSVGILTCYLDFIENGIVKAICERLPFDVVGIDTMSSATSRKGGPITLSLAVLTSDDVFFSTGISASLEHEHKDSLRELYERASAKHRDKPSLILSFAPVPQYSTAGDYLVEALGAASGGVPIFGMMASDFTTAFRSPLVIFNGEAYKDSMAVILLSGNVKPEFACMAVPENNTLKRKAVVTSSDGNILKEINGSPAIDYIQSIGLVKDNKLVTTQTVSLIVYYDDETEPVARSIFDLTSEGYLILGGVAPEGSVIGIGTLSPSDVVDMLSKMIDSLGVFDFLLVASCISRNFILGWDNMAEIDLIQSRLGEGSPFLFVYVAGEICPTVAADGTFINRFHNLTLVSCAL